MGGSDGGEDLIEGVAGAKGGGGFFFVEEVVAADVCGGALDGEEFLDDGFLVF